MKKKIVFDMDDILWALNQRICQRSEIPIDYNQIVTFHVLHNRLLTDEQKNILSRGYRSSDIFKNIVWNEGIEKMKILSQYDADIYINSDCCTESIAHEKLIQLKEILDIPEEHIILNIIGNSCKNIGDDVFAFVDDNSYNILSSHARYNLLVKKPWNSSLYAPSIPIRKEREVIYCDSLSEAIFQIIILLKLEGDQQ